MLPIATTKLHNFAISTAQKKNNERTRKYHKKYHRQYTHMNNSQSEYDGTTDNFVRVRSSTLRVRTTTSTYCAISVALAASLPLQCESPLTTCSRPLSVRTYVRTYSYDNV